MVQMRPASAGQLRAWSSASNRGTWCGGGPLAPTSYVSGPQKRPGTWQARHNVPRWPVGANHLRVQVAEPTTGHMVQEGPSAKKRR
eukprot:jgi/Tetstr1/444777/TSEL_032625.t1